MKRKITIEEIDDLQGQDKIAAQGINGDTELAHVNPWEEALLKALGGAGTTNPKTGLKQFYDINFPTDIYPSSTTASNTNSNSVSGSQSYSGLPTNYQKMLLSSVMPALSSGVANMEGNIDDYTNQALSAYQTAMNNNLKQNIPDAIGHLANRGILSSTEGENILSSVYNQALKDASTKGYESAMKAAELKANIPSILATIAKLGESTSSNTGSNTTSNSNSYSYYSDPTTMYQVMAKLLAGEL